MGRRILYLTQWFDPEQVVKGIKFAKGLRDKGYEVEVATGFPNYPSGRIAPGYTLKPYHREMMDGVPVHRLFLYPNHSDSSLGRSLNFLSFFLSSLAFCVLQGRRFDAVYVFHPPITVGLSAAVVRLLYGRPFVLDVQDLWPDSVVASGMKGTGMMAKVLNPLCDFVYRQAALVVGQSKSMTERLIERGVPRSKTATIFNWADEQAARAGGGFDTATLEFEGRFNFVFGGNLGRFQGLDTLVRAAARTALEAPALQLTIIGEGVERERIAELIKALGADNVKLRHGVPQSQIGDIFAAADVLVVHLLDDPLFEITIPSKTQFCMAMGKPILIGVHGEAAEVVTQAGAGVAVPPENVDAMAEAMIRMSRLDRSELEAMGRQAGEAYASLYSFAAAIAATDACLQKVLGAAAGAHEPK